MRTSGKQTSASNGRLKITLPNLTYPKAWAGSVPLCPVIFSRLVFLQKLRQLHKQNVLKPKFDNQPCRNFYPEISTQQENFRKECNHNKVSKVVVFFFGKTQAQNLKTFAKSNEFQVEIHFYSAFLAKDTY